MKAAGGEAARASTSPARHVVIKRCDRHERESRHHLAHRERAQQPHDHPRRRDRHDRTTRSHEGFGTVTAGNSSQITDGAAALLIMSEEKAAELGLRPRARFVNFALAGADPRLMLTAPIPATDEGAGTRRA